MANDRDAENTSEVGGKNERPSSAFRESYPGKGDDDRPSVDDVREIRDSVHEDASRASQERGDVTRTRRDASSSDRDEPTRTTRSSDAGRDNTGPGLDPLGNLSETGSSRDTTAPAGTPARRTLTPGQGLPQGCATPKVLMLTLSALVGQVFKR